MQSVGGSFGANGTPPFCIWSANRFPYREPRHRLAGSLTGAVASEKVTEAPKGALRLVGNQPLSVWVYSALDCETHRSSRDESRAK